MSKALDPALHNTMPESSYNTRQLSNLWCNYANGI